MAAAEQMTVSSQDVTDFTSMLRMRAQELRDLQGKRGTDEHRAKMDELRNIISSVRSRLPADQESPPQGVREFDWEQLRDMLFSAEDALSRELRDAPRQDPEAPKSRKELRHERRSSRHARHEERKTTRREQRAARKGLHGKERYQARKEDRAERKAVYKEAKEKEKKTFKEGIAKYKAAKKEERGKRKAERKERRSERRAERHGESTQQQPQQPTEETMALETTETAVAQTGIMGMLNPADQPLYKRPIVIGGVLAAAGVAAWLLLGDNKKSAEAKK